MAPTSPIYRKLFSYTKVLSVALNYRDQLTELHCQRVLGLAETMGKICCSSKHDLELLMMAAAFHDIGKIGTPDRILLKTSPLSDSEWLQMQQHADIGEKIMLSLGLKNAILVGKVIRHHHEHYDGSGYPDGLLGEDIPLPSRIITIVDSYDAMAEKRAYHQARSHEEIMEILHQETGKKHDPCLMSDFCRCIESSPLRKIYA